MKYLRLKGDEVAGISTADIVRTCVNHLPSGAKVDELRKRLRVVEALDHADRVLALEDADAETVQRCVAGMVWTKVHPGIVAFCDAVANLPSKPPEGET